MPLPIVAIVGRTNVGKSTLFNRLVGHRLAVVDDQPGITRDRLYAEVALNEHQVVLVDTGGLAGAESDELIVKVKEQAVAALNEADVLVMLVDGREGLTVLDHEVAEVLRRTGKPVVLAANKLETSTEHLEDFYELRLGQPLAISAQSARGVGELTEAIVEALPEGLEPEELIEGETAIAIVGRPNVGKSAIINRLLGEERLIVSEVPGTTRDAVDIAVEYEGRPFRLVDTAGLRRRSKRAIGAEYYSSLRTLRAVQRSDVALLVLDASEGVTNQDARIAGEIEQAGRGIVLVANKWDLVQGMMSVPEGATEGQQRRSERTHRQDLERIVRYNMPFLAYATLLLTSAVTGEGLEDLLPTAREVAEQFNRRIETSKVNRTIQDAVLAHQPPGRGRRPLKIYYATQVDTRPPNFVLKVNDPELCHFSYERYLRNRLREAFGLHGTPIKLRLERN